MPPLAAPPDRSYARMIASADGFFWRVRSVGPRRGRTVKRKKLLALERDNAGRVWNKCKDGPWRLYRHCLHARLRKNFCLDEKLQKEEHRHMQKYLCEIWSDLLEAILFLKELARIIGVVKWLVYSQSVYSNQASWNIFLLFCMRGYHVALGRLYSQRASILLPGHITLHGCGQYVHLRCSSNDHPIIATFLKNLP